MSLSEVQEGQAQSLLPKNTSTTQTTPTKQTNTTTRKVPSWKYGPSQNTAVQPTPIIILPPEDQPPVEEPVVMPPASQVVESTTPTVGPTPPTSVEKGLVKPTNIPSPEYQKSVQQARQTPPGETVYTARGPPGKYRDLITGRLQPEYTVSPEERAYLKFSASSPLQKTVTVLGSSLHNPIDFFGETPKYLYSRATGNPEEAQKGYFHNFLSKEINAAQNANTPLGAAGYIFESPYVNIPVFVTGMSGLGYLKGLGSTGAKVATGINRGIALYTGHQMITGGMEAYNAGELPNYLYKQGLYLGAMAGVGGGFSKEGELLGIRKKTISKLSDEGMKAEVLTKFKAMDEAAGLSSRGARVFEPASILGKDQGLRFNEAMMELKQNKIKAILGGSGSQSTFVDMTRQPHDIDFYVNDLTKTTEIMKKHDVDLSKLDIHEIEKPGLTISTKGVGYTEKPIKTPEGSIFDYQMRISEQALRKMENVYTPKHSLRGKDWIDIIDIGTQKFKDKNLVEELKKYQPELKPGTYELSGPSYYMKNPSEAPTIKFTWLERQLRKYGEPMDVSELWEEHPLTFVEPETFAKAEPFRPKFLEEYKTPEWAKGTRFFSSLASGGIAPSKYDFMAGYTLGGLIHQSYGGYPKEPHVQYPSIFIDKYIRTTPVVNYPKAYTEIKYTPHYTPPLPSYPKMPVYIPPYTPPTVPTYPTYPKYPEYPKSPTPPPYTPYNYPEEYPSLTPVPAKSFFQRTEPTIKEKKTEPEAFDVYVKDRQYYHGKPHGPESWKKINTSPLQEETALSLGATAVDNSAAASFKIKPTDHKPGKLDIGVDPWGMLQGEFYKKGNTYIEKTDNRIDTSGEIKGISALGWLEAQKKAGINFNMEPSRIDFKPQETKKVVIPSLTINLSKMMRGVGF